MPLTDIQRKRLLEELDAKGIDNKKGASVKAKWKSGKKAGKPLSDTYISQALNKGRGSYQGVELICDALGLDWIYVKDGKRRQLLLSGPSAAMQPLDYDHLHGLIEAALRVFGASPPDASSMAKNVVATWRGRQSRE